MLLQLLDHPLLLACPDSPVIKDNLDSAPIGALIITKKSVNTKKLEKQFEVQKRLLIAFLLAKHVTEICGQGLFIPK